MLHRFTKWYVKYIIIALACVLLLVVPLIKGPWIGTEPFLNYRMADSLSWEDPLSFGGRFAAYEWGTPLAFSPAPNYLMTILPLLLGVLSLFLLAGIIEKFSDDEMLQNVSLLMFVLSPAFIYTFSFANNLFLPLFLSLLIFYLFIQDKIYWLSLPLVIILPLFSVVLCIGVLLILLCYSLWKKEKRLFLLLLIILTLIVGGMYYGYIFMNAGLPERLSFEEAEEFSLFSRLFYDLGAAYGLGIFIALTAVLGFMQLWRKKYSNLFLFFSIALTLGIAFFFQENLLLLNLLLVPFAAYGFIFLSEAKWTNRNLRNLAFLVIVCGLAFSTVSQMDSLSESMPSGAIIEGLQSLNELQRSVVFSHYSRGVWINSAGHMNVMDENYLFVDYAEIRWNDSETLFYTRDLEVATEIFEKYDIEYIWIDEEMKEEIWDYDSEGLLFILEYTKDFNKVYDKEGVEIWEIDI